MQVYLGFGHPGEACDIPDHLVAVCSGVAQEAVVPDNVALIILLQDAAVDPVEHITRAVDGIGHIG